ncbi:MAG: HEAT repeat domain-containing protein [Pseudomonadota bacterium]
MNDFKGKPGLSPSSAGSMQLLHVITALNLIRMNLGMYPPGHSRITESVDYAFDLTQKILQGKVELFIGFAGDTITFGETAPDKEKNNSVFRDYAHCLNNLRIVSFTVDHNLNKKDLLEFNHILTSKPADIWAMGKIESVFSRTGIKGIKVKVIDADYFRLEEKKEIIPTKVDQKATDDLFWQEFFAGQKSEELKKSQSDGIPTDQQKTDPVEAVSFLNQQREDWPSAVVSYEKMLNEYFSEIPKRKPISSEKYATLIGVNSLVNDLNPRLKNQLIDVVERQFNLHSDTALVEENLKCFSDDIFIDILRRTNERGAQISPALVNLLKKMTGIPETTVPIDGQKGKDFSSEDMETLFKREKYENYVSEDYDRLLKKAAGTSSSGEDIDKSQFPLHKYLKTLTHEHVDFQICQLLHCIIDEASEEYYLSYSEKLKRSIPELLKAGRFSFLITVMETLRRHAIEKPVEIIRQKALSLLGSLSEKETIARYVAPFILKGTGEPAVLTQFLISSSAQNLSWLFDLYLDPKVPLSATIIEIMKGFGRGATEEAVKRLPDQDTQTIIRLLTFIREMDDSSVASSLRNLFHHEDWPVRREVIKTLIQFNDPAVIELLQKSLKAKDYNEVLEAVGLSCSYRVGDLLKNLTSMLKTFIILEKDTMLNEWIVGELVKTGHPSVIPHLERIAATWFTFSPKYLSRMKVTLYRNLHHFPKNQILELLQKGNRSRNEEIRTISAKILKARIRK